MIDSYEDLCGVTYYMGVEPDTLMSDLQFHEIPYAGISVDDRIWELHTNLGIITVLDRMTWRGWRDIWSGYLDKEYELWLASGNFDIRNMGCNTVQEAIDCIKQNANICKGG